MHARNFLTEFENFIEDSADLRRCLIPMIEEKAIATVYGKKMIHTDSLIKVLLGLGPIQTNVIQLLIEKVVDLYLLSRIYNISNQQTRFHFALRKSLESTAAGSPFRR